MRLLFAVCWIACALPVIAADVPLKEKEWTVDDVKRKALLHIPEGKGELPVVFGFHGHGGSMKNAANSFGMHKQWPEAIVVYMDGLPTPGRLTDPEGKKQGWQSGPGEMKDRDLKFFDAVLESLKKDYKVDSKRIYCMGHSNGGSFTYILWSARGDVFAAVAPSAAPPPPKANLKPKPAMHVAGENDPLVKYEWQKLGMDYVLKINGCDTEGKSWAKEGTLVGTIYESKIKTPFVSLISPGTHNFPKEAPALMVKFFKEHSKD
ncbi:hypothetical protein BH11PLA2_BH11PLA2_18230 [soil metagenome]